MTGNIVPRADSSGNIGSTLKRWADGFFDTIYVTALGEATTGVSAAASDDSTKLATTAHVKDAIAAATYTFPIELHAGSARIPDDNEDTLNRAAAQTNGIAYYYLDYPHDELRKAQWGFMLPSTWNASAVLLTVNSVTESAASGDAVFSIYGIRIASGSDFDAEPVLIGTVTTTYDSTTKRFDSSSLSMTITGSGYYTVLELRRDYTSESDTLDGAVRVIGMNLKATCTFN